MASFIIVMAMTDPDAPPYQRYSMFVVPGDTPGINVLRDVGLGYQPLGAVDGGLRPLRKRAGPDDHMLGPRGGAFVVAQTHSAAAVSTTRCARSGWSGASST